MVDLNNVYFKYSDNYVLRNCSYSFENKFYHIKGKSGIGKSTLFDIIYGLLTPLQGTVVSKGNIAYFPQFTYPIFFEQTVDLEFKMQMYNFGVNYNLYDLFNILELDYKIICKKNPYLLSFENQKLLTFLITIMQDFQVLLLDELEIGISWEKYLLISSYIKNKFSKKTIIFSSHSEQYLDIYNHIPLELKEGEVVEL